MSTFRTFSSLRKTTLVSIACTMLAACHDRDGNAGQNGDGDGDGDDSRDDGGSSEGEDSDTVGSTTESVDRTCLVDADCGPKFSCALGVCTPGCIEDAECDDGHTCDPHGHCVLPDAKPQLPPQPKIGSAELSAVETTLGNSGTATVVLKNTSSIPVRFRLDAFHAAVTHDKSVRTVGAGGEVEIQVAVDRAMLSLDTVGIPIEVVTDSGRLTWIVTIPVDRSGYYQGTVAFLQPTNLGASRLGLNLAFAEDGTVTGQTFSDDSLLWPTDVVVSGMWSKSDGTFSATIHDIVPDVVDSGDAIVGSPLARKLGRELVLEGAFDETGRALEGKATEEWSGLVGERVKTTGSFAFHFTGSSRTPTNASDVTDEVPLPPPSIGFPAALDEDACSGLGSAFGGVGTLAFPDTCSPCVGTAVMCTANQARTCADALVEAAANLASALPRDDGASTLDAPDPAAWSGCVAEVPTYEDNQTCFDQRALACAGYLYRLAWNSSVGGDQASFARAWIEQVSQETLAGSVLGTEKLVQAAFAYQDVLPDNILSKELELLQAANGLITRPLLAVASYRYLDALETLGAIEVVDEREGVDLVRTINLVSNYAEILSLQFALQQRADPDAAVERAEQLRHMAVWLHALGVMLKWELDLFGLEDDYDKISILGETVIELGAQYRELGIDRNPFGYPHAYVPMRLSPTQADMGVSNFQVIWDASQVAVEQFEQVATLAQVAEVAFWQNTWEAQQRASEIESAYNERLATLCGYDGDSEPALDTCGKKSGEIFELVKQIEAAAIQVEAALTVVKNGRQRIDLEESRMAQMIANFDATKGKIDAQNDEIWKVIQDGASARSAAQEAAAEAECGRIKRNTILESMELAGQCIIDAANAKITAPLVAGGCTMKGVALVARGGIECEAAREQAGVQSELHSIDRQEQQELQAVNAEIDGILRQSALNEQVINSQTTVENMRLDIAEQAIQVELQQKNYEIAQARLNTVLEEVSALVVRRGRALELVSKSPSNPGTNPRFLQARLELGRNVLRWREAAARKAYLAGRALEYDINRETNKLRRDLYTARSPFEMAQYMTCLKTVHDDYLLAVGVPQQYVTEISLRDDVLGLGSPTIDEVTGAEISPAEQFQAVLRDPANHRIDGTVALPMTLSLHNDALFSTLLCDDRIENVAVKVVGDYIGDNEIEIVLTRENMSSLRRCDAADLAPSDAIVKYELESRRLVVSAGANDFGLAQPNAGFAAWPVGGEGWLISLPPADQSPANADLDPHGISDIVVRITHRASTVGQSGTETFSPDCR